jgi:ribosome-associated protein
VEIKQLIDYATNIIFSKKGKDVVLMDLRCKSNFCDYFIICSVESDAQARAVADELYEKLKKIGVSYLSIEGYEYANWILIDLYEIIIHIFMPETRLYYGLEKLWGDAIIENLKDPLETSIKLNYENLA